VFIGFAAIVSLESGSLVLLLIWQRRTPKSLDHSLVYGCYHQELII